MCAGAVVHHKLDTVRPQQLEKDRQQEQTKKMDRDEAVPSPAAAAAPSSQVPVSSQSASCRFPSQTLCAPEDCSQTQAGTAHASTPTHDSPPHAQGSSQIPQSANRHASMTARPRSQGRGGQGGTGGGGGGGGAGRASGIFPSHKRALERSLKRAKRVRGRDRHRRKPLSLSPTSVSQEQTSVSQEPT